MAKYPGLDMRRLKFGQFTGGRRLSFRVTAEDGVRLQRTAEALRVPEAVLLRDALHAILTALAEPVSAQAPEGSEEPEAVRLAEQSLAKL